MSEGMSDESAWAGKFLAHLMDRAKRQKRRVRMRLVQLYGGYHYQPSRGPIDANGRRCVRWHFWQQSRAKHEAITDQITGIKSLMRKAQAGGQEAKGGRDE